MDTETAGQAGFDPDNYFIAPISAISSLNVAATPCSDASGLPIVNCAPATGLRQDALKNAPLNFVPQVSSQMCGLHSDSEVPTSVHMQRSSTSSYEVKKS